MAYIGKQPIVGNYQVLDSLTATTTDTYALTKNSVAVFPQTPANCIVSLNGVIQAPFDSYTISGSNIVFASALTASDSIDFITVLGDVLNVGTVSDGTIGLAKLSATGTKDATTFLRGDNTFASAGGTMTPAFLATQANNGISNGVYFRVNYANEVYDTDNCYDNTTNYRFTPTTAGWYYIFARVAFDNDSATARHVAAIRKNGTEIARGDLQLATSTFANNNTSMQVDYIVQFNGTTDYVEVYGYAESNGATKNTAGYGCFGGYRIIE